jgi:hypothetical protein
VHQQRTNRNNGAQRGAGRLSFAPASQDSALTFHWQILTLNHLQPVKPGIDLFKTR